MDGTKRNGSDTFGFVLFNALRGVFVREFLVLGSNLGTYSCLLYYFYS